MHHTWNGTHTIDRGEKVGIWVWHSLAPVRLLMPDSVASLANRCGMYNQVLFLKLPTSLSSRQGMGWGHMLVFLV